MPRSFSPFYRTGRNSSHKKYNNSEIIVDGIKFDSKKESAYYSELKQRKKAGDIMDFKLQPKYILQEGFRNSDGQWIRPIVYFADFVVYHDGLMEIVDVKGYPTDLWKIKWKMMQYRFRNKEYKLTIV